MSTLPPRSFAQNWFANTRPRIDSILFLTFSLFLIASVIYLPNHILTMSRRTYYYFAGDNVNNTLAGGANGVAERVYGTASEWAQTAYQTAFNRTGSAAGVAEKVVEKASEVASAAAVESSSAAAMVAEGARNAAQQVVEGN